MKNKILNAALLASIAPLAYYAAPSQAQPSLIDYAQPKQNLTDVSGTWKLQRQQQLLLQLSKYGTTRDGHYVYDGLVTGPDGSGCLLYLEVAALKRKQQLLQQEQLQQQLPLPPPQQKQLPLQQKPRQLLALDADITSWGDSHGTQAAMPLS